MCNFFSFCSDGKKKYYFNWQDRQTIKGLNFDSHASIAEHFKLKEDDLNKYEYNPLTKKLIKDNICCEEDVLGIKSWCDNLDWKLIVEPLIVKPIINPFSIEPKIRIDEAVKLLREYNSVSNSVSNSIFNSIFNSIRNSVSNSVSNSIRESIYDSIFNSIRESVFNSVFNSIYDIIFESIRKSVSNSVSNSIFNSIRESVSNSVSNSIRESIYDNIFESIRESIYDNIFESIRKSIYDNIFESIRKSISNSVYVYYSSFFHIKYEYDFSSMVKLWESGYVSSFDGKIWRLHCGKNAKIVWEEKI